MSKFGKGCLYSIICIGLFLGILKLFLGEYLDMLLFPAMLFLPIIILFCLGIVGEALSELIKAGKWIGLGAILGNVFNNKINANASIKAGKQFQKQPVQTKHGWLNRCLEFINPSTHVEEVVQVNHETGEAVFVQAESKETETNSFTSIDPDKTPPTTNNDPQNFEEFLKYQEFLKWKEAQEKSASYDSKED